jgi:large subunit ribosomal protein L2
MIKLYKPYTPSRRAKSTLDFSMLSKISPEKNLLSLNQRAKGRNNKGRITIRHKGGGHKRRYRLIDFKRNKLNIEGKVITIEYDPNRNVFICLILYEDGEKKYILCPEKLKINDIIVSKTLVNEFTSLNIGDATYLKNIPVGTLIHNVEINPKKGGQLIRSAGTYAKILSKEKKGVIIELSSGEVRLFHENCRATIGKLGNSDFRNINLGKAGTKRWLGIRPTVRGSAMNAIDHPHGGGEGRCPIGKSSPRTPWGKIALGVKTRKKRKLSDIFIKN